MGMRPGWVAGLVAESFFVACPAHENHKKNERNIFCLACCASICPNCAAAHRHHPLLQVRSASPSSLPPLSIPTNPRSLLGFSAWRPIPEHLLPRSRMIVRRPVVPASSISTSKDKQSSLLGCFN